MPSKCMPKSEKKKRIAATAVNRTARSTAAKTLNTSPTKKLAKPRAKKRTTSPAKKRTASPTKKSRSTSPSKTRAASASPRRKKKAPKASATKAESMTPTESIEALGDLNQFRTPENLLGTEGKEGATYLLQTNAGYEFAMKTFRKQKSAAKIAKEATLQNIAASVGVAPAVLKYNGLQKYIIMDRLHHRVVDLAKEKQNRALTEKQQTSLMECLDKLDEAKVLHNDGNVLNIMEDDNGNLFLIDYGFSRELKTADFSKNKHGKHPNTKLTLYMMEIGFKRYRVKAPLLTARVKEYMTTYKQD